MKFGSLKSAIASPLLFAEVSLRLALVEGALYASDFKSAALFFSKNPLRRPFLTREKLKTAQVFLGSIERHVFRRPSCLTTSFVLFWMSEPGTILNIGVRKNSKFFEAHAWVERHGEIFSTTEDLSQFENLLTLRRGRA
jgi:hypothetical protein